MSNSIRYLLVSICLIISVMLFSSCYSGQANVQDPDAWVPVSMPDGELSDLVLSEYNNACKSTFTDENGVTEATEISCFFTSSYYSAEDLDLANFLKYCPLGTPVTDEEEFQEVRAAASFEFGADKLSNMPTPVWKFDRKDVDELLLKYAGITTEELSSGRDSLRDTVYVESRDAYYNLTSDFGPGSFTAVSGVRQGDMVTLTDSKGVVLTIEIIDGYPLIRSFVRDDPDEIAIVYDLFSAYLESFKKGGHNYDSVLNIYLLDYSVDVIDIADDEFKQRLSGEGPFTEATEDAIFASVHYSVTIDPTENNLNYWLPANGVRAGDVIHKSYVLYIDKVDGEYQIVSIGTGW